MHTLKQKCNPSHIQFRHIHLSALPKIYSRTILRLISLQVLYMYSVNKVVDTCQNWSLVKLQGLTYILLHFNNITIIETLLRQILITFQINIIKVITRQNRICVLNPFIIITLSNIFWASECFERRVTCSEIQFKQYIETCWCDINLSSRKKRGKQDGLARCSV